MIRILSERIIAISNHSDICFRTIWNHFEPIRKTFCIWFDEKSCEKSIRLNPIHSVLIRGINPKESELGLIQTKFSIRMNPRLEWLRLIRIENSIWCNPKLDVFGLKIWFVFIRSWFNRIENLDRIDSNWKFGLDLFELILRIKTKWIGLNQINFWPFYIKGDTKCFSDWFKMICNDLETDFKITRNSFDLFG